MYSVPFHSLMQRQKYQRIMKKLEFREQGGFFFSVWAINIFCGLRRLFLSQLRLNLLSWASPRPSRRRVTPSPPPAPPSSPRLPAAKPQSWGCCVLSVCEAEKMGQPDPENLRYSEENRFRTPNRTKVSLKFQQSFEHVLCWIQWVS